MVIFKPPIRKMILGCLIQYDKHIHFSCAIGHKNNNFLLANKTSSIWDWCIFVWNI